MFYEIRTEHARAGRGAELVRYMDEIVVPLHREVGMEVVGTFSVTGDEDAFVWIRRFADDADRDRVLDAVHRHPRCPAMIDTVSALVGRAESVVRLEPTPGSGLDGAGRPARPARIGREARSRNQVGRTAQSLGGGHEAGGR